MPSGGGLFVLQTLHGAVLHSFLFKKNSRTNTPPSELPPWGILPKDHRECVRNLCARGVLIVFGKKQCGTINFRVVGGWLVQLLRCAILIL